MHGDLLSYRVTSQISGKIAQLGTRLVDSAAQKLAGDFFGTFNALVSQAPEPNTQPAPESPVLPRPSATLLARGPLAMVLVHHLRGGGRGDVSSRVD